MFVTDNRIPEWGRWGGGGGEGEGEKGWNGREVEFVISVDRPVPMIVLVKCWKVAYWNAMRIVANIQYQKSNTCETTGSPLARYESLEQHYTA